jgi:Ala-tRNA(Pro) deacylase
MPITRLQEILDRNNIRYTIMSHSPAYTAAAIAAVTHTPGKEIAKSVIVLVDGALAMVVLPGSKHVDLGALKKAMGAKEVSLAHEHQFAHVFPDCEVGAMPPFGNLYGVPVYIDQSLSEDNEIAFNAGSHRVLLRMAFSDYQNLVKPLVLSVAASNVAMRLAQRKAVNF